MKPFFALLLTACSIVLSHAASNSQKVDYTPHFHGTLRTRLEVNTTHGEYRFQVRNARLSLDGKIASWADYFVQTDLCDQGKMKILDAWARITPTKGLSFQAGQFRIPFGVETFRGPHTYVFANRSFMGKQICNYRAVGFKSGYTFGTIPMGIEAGIFNPTTIGDHSGWSKDLAFGSKLWYKLHNVTFTSGFQSIHPSTVRANLVDASIAWHTDRWQIEGEYMYEYYAHSAHKPAHSYVAFADYRMPIKAWKFNRLSF
ncbi:MAG: OprO/OprP family phosphate-selective porin, partial [Paramuribaculum sp.]|nr:OprO/OprP family phosphate-selective porin [Paramuribaculum sp.]